MSFSFRKQCGFSLIEILLVMGIFFILMVAAFVVFPQVQGAKQAQEELGRMAPTIAGLRAYQDSLPDNAPVPTLDDLLAARLLPSEAIRNGQWVSESGQPISLEGQSGQWVITYQGLEPSFCQRFVGGMLDSFHNQFSNVSVNGHPSQTLSEGGLGTACQKPHGGQTLVSFVLAKGTESFVPFTGREASDSEKSVPPVTDPKFVDPKGKKWGTNEGI